MALFSDAHVLTRSHSDDDDDDNGGDPDGGASRTGIGTVDIVKKQEWKNEISNRGR